MKKSNYLKRALFAVVALFSGFTAWSQITVVATAGVMGPTPYANLAAAFAAINAGTHQGDIGIGISASTVEAGPCVLNASGAGAALYTTVLIQPIVDGITVSAATASGRGVIELNGADNVTIDGDNPNTAGTNRNLTIINTAANTVTYTSVVRIALSTLVTSGDNNTVKNCILTGNATGRFIAGASSTTGSENTTYGILVGGGASTVANTTAPSAITSVTTTLGAGITALNFTANNNAIDACARGIAVMGSATSVATPLTITANVIGNATPMNTTTVYSRGITIQGFNNATVADNTFQNLGFYVATACGAIWLGDASTAGTNAIVERNKINTVINGNTGTYGAYGINVNSGNNHIIRNNFVQGINHDMSGGVAFSTTFGIHGIRVAAGTGHSIVYNSVHMYGSRIGTATTSLLSSAFTIVGTGPTGCTVENNIFSNTMTGGTTSVASVSMCLPSGATSSLGLTLNNNFYYEGVTAGASGILQVGTTYSAANLYTAANFIQGSTTPSTNSRSYTSTLSVSGTNDNASWASSAAAPFTSSSDLHINNLAVNAADVDGRALVIGGITTDIDNALRNVTTPDIGADEFSLPSCVGSVGGTISPSTATICAGLTLPMSSTGATTGLGITYQWQVATVSGGPYSNVVGGSGANTVSYTTGALTAGTFYYVLQVTCSTGPSTGYSNELMVTVNPSPTVTVTPPSTSLCIPGAPLTTLNASGATTYSWAPASGLSSTTGASVDALPGATVTYTVTGTGSNGCTSTATAAFTVSEGPSMSPPTATPPSICNGANSQLNTSAGTTSSYVVTSIPFAAVATPGSGVTTLSNAGVAVTPLSSGTLDDGGWQNIALPFNFLYFGAGYSSFAVSTNGFIFLGTGAPPTFTGYSNAFPSTFACRPAIGAMYSDLDFRTVGTINYFITGTAPYRALVVNWSGGNFYNTVGSLNTQLIIYETSNIIEVHTTSSTGTNSAVEGIQNPAGTTAFNVTGRNNVTWAVSTPDGYRWTPSGGTPTYSWTPATFLSSTTIANPMANAVTATTTYTVTATIGSCSSTGSVTLTAGATLSSSGTISPAAAVCTGTNITLNSTPAGGGAPYTYAWTGPNSFTSTLQSPTISGVTAANAGTYTLVITDNCTATTTMTLTLAVNPLPVITATPASATYCSPGGTPVTMTGSGATTYTWAPATGLSSTTGTSVDASPAATTTYTVTGTDANGCSSTTTAAITAAPSVTMGSTSVSPATICAGDTAALSTGASVNNTYCQPVYTTGTTFGDYVGGVVLGTINNPTVGAGAPYYTLFPASGSTTTTLVAGNTYTITLRAGTYTINDLAAWIDFNQNGNLADVGEKLGETDNLGASPASTSFTFTVPAGAYNGTTRLRVRDMDHSGTNDMDPCAAQSIYGETEDYIITITGGVPDPSLTYTWSPATYLSSTSGASVNANAATSTTTYTVTASTVAGCSAIDSVTLSVNPLPVLTASASPAAICAGDSTTLTSSGATSYAWSPGSLSGSTVTVGPSSNTTYVLTGTDGNGCSDTVQVPVVVNGLPVVTLSGNNAICSGDSTLLTGSSGGTSQWYLNGVAIAGATSNTYMATAAGVYNMTKTNVNGCTDSAATGITVMVNALPTVALGPDASLCATTIVLDAQNAGSAYMWNDNSTSQTLTAGTTGVYWVDVTDGNGCTSRDSIMVTVNVLPVFSLGADTTTCSSNGPVVLTAPSGAYTYMWIDSTASSTFSASGSGTYWLMVTDSITGCSYTDSMMVTVNPAPSFTLGADSTTCSSNGPIVLTAPSGAYSYMWSDSTSGSSISVSASGTYWLTTTDSLTGCSLTDSIMVTFTPDPVVNLGPDTAGCGLITLAGPVGPYTYLWSDSSTSQTLDVTTSGGYTLTVTDTTSGCTGSDAVNVTINTPPTVTFSMTSTVCVNDAALTLSGTPAGGTFSGPGITGSTFNPAIAGVGSYTITYSYTDANGCSNTANDQVTVSACVGVTEISSVASGISVFPNPNSGAFVLTIDNADFKEMTIEIMSVEGKRVYSDIVSNVSGQFIRQIDMSDIANGTYYLRITTDTETVVKKVVRNK